MSELSHCPFCHYDNPIEIGDIEGSTNLISPICDHCDVYDDTKVKVLQEENARLREVLEKIDDEIFDYGPTLGTEGMMKIRGLITAELKEGGS